MNRLPDCFGQIAHLEPSHSHLAPQDRYALAGIWAVTATQGLIPVSFLLGSSFSVDNCLFLRSKCELSLCSGCSTIHAAREQVRIAEYVTRRLEPRYNCSMSMLDECIDIANAGEDSRQESIGSIPEEPRALRKAA